MKARKQSIQLKNSHRNIQTSNKQIMSSKAVPNSNKKLAKEIQKLQKQIELTTQDIKQTEKHLDVDLFLKQQKKKKQEHAKNLNAEYQAQKKIREQKLYKKFNRDKREKQEDSKTSNSIKQNNMLFFKSNNVSVFTPTAIIKSITNQFENQRSQWVRSGHIFRDQECGDLEGLRMEEERIFGSLYRNQENEKVKYDGDIQSKHITWKNIQQVCQNSLQLKTLPDQPQQHQFLIGSTQDQQILNSLSLMTKQLSSYLFAETENTFSAKLNCPTKALTVVTDKKILVREFVHKNINLGARCHNSNIIWPTLVQKCYMKVQKYSGYEPGKSKSSLLQAIFTIYGLDAEIIPITNQNVIKENFPLVLGHLLQEGRIGFMNLGRAKKTSYEGRIYLLQSVREEVVHQSKDQKKTEILYKIRDIWKGKLLDSSNNNKFNLLELLGQFNTVVILRSYPQKWSCLRINFSYFSTGPIAISNNQWTKNPQYLFTITKTISLRIILKKSSNNIEQTATENSNSQNIYGFLLFENKQAQNKIQCMKMEALIVKTKCNDFNGACYSGELPKGNYIVIPYSTYKNQKAYQFYTLDFVVEREGAIDFGKARIHQWEYVTEKGARLAQGQKLIQSLQSRQKFIKPKIQKIDLPKLFPEKLTKKILQTLNLNLYEKCQLKHFFMPGFIKKLLINTSVEVESAITKNMTKKTTKSISHEELTKQEQAESLAMLLGYDVLSEEINQGRMREYQEQSVGIYDFRDFCLGEEGLVPILECLSQHPQLIELNFSGNQLNDSAITYLCYYLQKTNRVELRQLNVTKNPIGFNGKNALQGLKSTYPKINIQATGLKFQ